MRWNGFLLTTACLLVVSGRKSRGPPADWNDASTNGGPAGPSHVIVTPAPGNAGHVTAVNASARYVVVSYSAGIALPVAAQRLSVYRKGLKVAEIKITGPSRDTHTVGDIVAGECQLGDEVRRE